LTWQKIFSPLIFASRLPSINVHFQSADLPIKRTFILVHCRVHLNEMICMEASVGITHTHLCVVVVLLVCGVKSGLASVNFIPNTVLKRLSPQKNNQCKTHLLIQSKGMQLALNFFLHTRTRTFTLLSLAVNLIKKQSDVLGRSILQKAKKSL